jgi:hypothetical protein
MERTSHFGLTALVADQAPGQDHLLLMRAHILAGIPLTAAGKIKDGDLLVFVFNTGTPVFRECTYFGGFKPELHFG